jgi:hypothetical protein
MLLATGMADKTVYADIVSVSMMVFHPAANPTGQRTYGVDEDLFAQPLFWDRAGVLARTVTLTVGDATRLVPAGKLLQEVVMRGVPGLPNVTRTAYCTDPVRILLPTMAVGSYDARFYNRQSPQQLCVTDVDSDGRVDHAFVINGRDVADSVAKEIAPVAYEVRVMATSKDFGDRINISFLGRSGGKLNFGLRVTEGGQKVEFRSLSADGDTTNGVYSVPIRDGWPQRAEFYGVAFTVTGYDANTKRVSIAWTEPRDDDKIKRIPPISAMY